MASWDVIEVGSDYFKIGVYNLEKAFSDNNYKAVMLTAADYGTDCVTIGNVKFIIRSFNTTAKSFESTLSAEPDTTYTLYCYVLVNDSSDSDPYYKIGGRITFTTLSEESALTAPNEPELIYRFQTFDDYPDAYIKLSGMAESGVAYCVQSKKYGSGEIFEYYVTGTSATKTEKLSELCNATGFCTTYMLRLGAVNEETGESAWSGWAEITTSPDNNSFFLTAARVKKNIRISSTAHPITCTFSYYLATLTLNGDVKSAFKIYPADLNSEESYMDIGISETGEYQFRYYTVYEKSGVQIYAVGGTGDKAYGSVTIDYRRPAYFEWEVLPTLGLATDKISRGQWNMLCINVRNVICGFKDRDDITIPYNETLYGTLGGRSAADVLNTFDTDIKGNPITPPRGIKMSNDKTLYAWRYNALNYIICCENNSDSETDVTGENYDDKFTSGKVVYARHLTALSDKLNKIV